MARESRAAWERRVRRWERSGQSAAEFAAREGVNARTLAFWKWKLGSPKLPSRTKAPRALDFVEVMPATVQNAPVEIVVERYRLRLDRSIDAAAIARVLDVVRGRA